MKFIFRFKCIVLVMISMNAFCGDLPQSSNVVGDIHRDENGNLVPTIQGEATSDRTDIPKSGVQDTGEPKSGTKVVKKYRIAGAITEVEIESTGTQPQIWVPVTFGQIFAKGDLSSTDGVIGKANDGSLIPLQLNVKATYADGSIKHGIISAILPSLMPHNPTTLGLIKSGSHSKNINAPSSAPASPDSNISDTASTTPEALLTTGFDASVNVVIGGINYSASVAPLLKKRMYSTWLSGAIVNEWLVTAPLVSSKGESHPLLSARFAIRSFTGTNAVKVDVVLENDWAYQNKPQNLTYDVSITVGGKNVYSKSALTHFSSARWRKSFWWGTEPQINIREDTAYLIASKALPNYDQSFAISGKALSELQTGWKGPKTEPMGAGNAVAYMPMTGGRGDIGLLPSWNVLYLLSMDRRARDVALGTADLAGTWSVHYRDRKTDRPISLDDFPYMTILGHKEDTLNPVTKKYEKFPDCPDCKNPNEADSSHEPAFNYLPYLLTGDYYQLEELQFWAMWNAFKTNPGYRGNRLGLINPSQVRDQAWSLRNLAEAAFISPDRDPLKPIFQKIVTNNLAWYNTNYSGKADANRLGVIVDGFALAYDNETGIAPWQDDFFTATVGHVAELGFAGAGPLLRYKAKFPVSRMGEKDYCWILASTYKLIVRPTSRSPYYASIAQTYQPSLVANYGPVLANSIVQMACNSSAMANALKTKTDEMVGYSSSAVGFPSNLQPALAYAVDADVPGAKAAWIKFMQRSAKPDYSGSPQFAIVPR